MFKLTFRICRKVLDPKSHRPKLDPITKKPKLECVDVTKDLPIETNPKIPKKDPGPLQKGLPAILQKLREKGLSQEIEQDIKTLVALAEHASSIRNPDLQREFAAFAQNSTKHCNLPEGYSLNVEAG